MTLPDTDQPLEVRYPVVDAFNCPHCGAYIGDIIQVNGSRWLRMYNQPAGSMCQGVTVTVDVMTFKGRCGACVRPVHWHG